VKAAAVVGIPRHKVILIGNERDDGFQYFSEMLGDVEGSRKILHPDKDLSFLVDLSGITGLSKGVMLRFFLMWLSVWICFIVEKRQLLHLARIKS